MRKAMFFIFVVVGAAVGLASALTDDWGVKAVMMTIGAVTGAALGGAISGSRPAAGRSCSSTAKHCPEWVLRRQT